MLAATSAEILPTRPNFCCMSMLESSDLNGKCFGDVFGDNAAPCMPEPMAGGEDIVSATFSSQPCVASGRGCSIVAAEPNCLTSCWTDLGNCRGGALVEQCCRAPKIRWADLEDSPKSPSESTIACSETNSVDRKPRLAYIEDAPKGLSDSAVACSEAISVDPKPLLADLEDSQKSLSDSTMASSEISSGHPKPQWADLTTEDELAPAPRGDLAEHVETTVSPTSGGLQLRRPRFSRPSREQRVAQVARAMHEFCTLDFEAVDAAEQSGLVLRMLATLKSLASPDVFWNEAGEKCEEERYALLGLQEQDMYVLGRHIRRADKLSDKRRFREAFEALCKARPWLSASDLEALRLDCRATNCANQRKDDKKINRRITTMESPRECRLAEDVESWTSVRGKKSASDRSDGTHHGHTERTGMGHAPEMLQCDNLGDWKAARPRRHTLSAKEPRGRNSAGRPDQPLGHSKVSSRGNSTFTGTKLQCQFNIGIEEESKFRVVRKLLGPAGAHMKRINSETGAKLRLRGRGSKFLEGPEQQESQDPLMLCVSAPDRDAYDRAVDLVREILEGVYREYREFCAKTGQRAPDLEVDMHHGARDGAVVTHGARSSIGKDGW